MAQSTGNKIHIGSLMVIVSIKVLKNHPVNGLSKLELCFEETQSRMRIKQQCLTTLQPQLPPALVDLT